MQYGCPYDCGLCPDYMQHSCVTVVEITENCNLRCPVCYAESGPEQSRHAPFSEVIAKLDAVVANEGEPDVLQLSGGEPTLHPEFFKILDAVRERPIRHLMINTNGIRIAQEPEFAEHLCQYLPGFEIYLQFDSLRDVALQDLRGARLAQIHQHALERLEACGISTTLVMTVKRGVNDDEIGEIINHALQWDCVRGVTLQPVQDAGRIENFGLANRLTVSEIRRKIAEQSDLFSLDDILPVPCNPDTLAMAYALKQEGATLPLTRWLKPSDFLADGSNSASYEANVELKNRLFSLFSTNLSAEGQSAKLSELLCCLPKLNAEGLSYRNVFRLLIVQFMDAHNLDIRSLKKSCVHIAQADGKMIPFEAYNLFYRGERAQLTQTIQGEIVEWTGKRNKH